MTLDVGDSFKRNENNMYWICGIILTTDQSLWFAFDGYIRPFGLHGVQKQTFLDTKIWIKE